MLVQIFVNGLLVGGIYAMVALGLNLVFGVLRIINFAHGHFLMLGMYAALTLWRYGLDPYVSILIVVPALFLFGALCERWLIRYTLAAPAHVKIFVTLGLAIAMENLALLVFKADYLSVKVPYQTSVWQVMGVSVSVTRTVAFAAMLATSAALFLFLGRTDFGRAIRATAQDRATARLMGINVDRVQLITFAIGSAIVGLAACLMMPIYAVYPTVGVEFVTAAFVIVVLGGLGSLHGALFGGLLIGVIEQASAYFMDSALRQLVYFLLFMVVLAVRPAGLFGQRGAEEIGLK
ncbi:branched-chain amino acid ABC transporter permease [Variovorax sp. E3]|uniref:branched-chain amino acid ABC transporter permease n=1 Tax=Variovorax sp. E3 TaxID=1914993 RepID=UPI0018DB9DAA|nr:branched-chain amino acid ABC transporter permease [Variovorax sp. E3]